MGNSRPSSVLPCPQVGLPTQRWEIPGDLGVKPRDSGEAKASVEHKAIKLTFQCSYFLQGPGPLLPGDLL